MKPLKAAATTSQPVLTVAQIETIFFKVPELYEVHKEFYDGLLPRVQQWSHHQRVGDLFQKLVRTKGQESSGVGAVGVGLLVLRSLQKLNVSVNDVKSYLLFLFPPQQLSSRPIDSINPQ